MFSSSDSKKSPTQYLSPATDAKEFNVKVDELEKKSMGVKRKNSLLIENEEGKEVVYQREDSPLGEGANGIAYEFSDLQKSKKNKVVKIDKRANKYVQLFSGLHQELQLTREDKDCEYPFLIDALQLELQKSPRKKIRISTIIENIRKKNLSKSEIIRSLSTSIVWTHEQIRLRAEENKADWDQEVAMMQRVYGSTEVLPGDYRLSMPLLGKKTVADVIEAKPRKSLLELLDLFLNVIHAYEVFHLFLIAHIDLKSDNMLIDNDGCIWPCDLGQASEFGKIVQFSNLDTTTPSQYAPEEKAGVKADAKLDIYSLGRLGNGAFLHYMNHSPQKSDVKDEKQFYKDFEKICGEMNESKPDARVITLHAAKSRLQLLRAKHFPKAPPLQLKLNPIFTQKKAIHDATRLNDWKEVKTLLDQKFSESFLKQVIDQLVILKKWDTLQEIQSSEFKQKNTVHPLFINAILRAIDDPLIPEDLLTSTLRLLEKSRQGTDIRRIAEKLYNIKRELGRTFSNTVLVLAQEKQWELLKFIAIRKPTFRRGLLPSGYAAIHFAVLHKEHKVMKTLLLAGAEPNHQMKENLPAPIHVAIDNNDEKAVQLLLEHKANVHAMYKSQNVVSYAHRLAIAKNDWKIMNLILKHLDTTFSDTFVDAMLASCNPDTINIIVNHPHVSEPQLINAYHQAAVDNNWDLVRLLSKHLAHCNPRDTDGMTPLHLAIRAKKHDVAKQLLRDGATVGFQLNGKTPAPIHIAIDNQDEKGVKLLFEYPFDVFNINYCDQSLSQYAVNDAIKNNDWKIILTILNEKPFLLRSILDCLISEKKWDVIECLTQHTSGKKFPHLFEKAVLPAARAGKWELVECIVKIGIKQHIGEAFNLAVAADNPETVKKLLPHIDAKITPKHKVLDVAIDTKKWNSVHVILDSLLSEYPPIEIIEPIFKRVKKENPVVIGNLQHKINALMIHYMNRDDVKSVVKLQKKFDTMMAKDTKDKMTQWKKSNFLKGLPGCSIGGIIGAIVGFFIPLPGATFFGMAVGFAVGGYIEKYIRDNFMKKREFPIPDQDPSDGKPPSYPIKHLSFPTNENEVKQDLSFNRAGCQLEARWHDKITEDKINYQFLRQPIIGAPDEKPSEVRGLVLSQ